MSEAPGPRCGHSTHVVESGPVCPSLTSHTHLLHPDTMLPMIEFEPFRTVYNNHNKKCWKKTKCKRMVRKLTRATDKQFYK